jgi:tetratricopeptide (TPR) repeat protein
MMRYARLLSIVLLILLAACAHRPDGPGSALSAEEHLRLASIYESKGEIDLALKHFTWSIEKDGGNPGAHFALGNLNLKLGKYGDAERSYLKAISLDPEFGVVYNNLGWLYMEMGDLNKAEAMAHEAVKRDPAMRFVFLDTLGVIQTRAGEYAEAEKSLTEAAALIPTDDNDGLLKVYNHLLELYRATGEDEKAIEMEQRLKAAF